MINFANRQATGFTVFQGHRYETAVGVTWLRKDFVSLQAWFHLNVLCNVCAFLDV